MRIAAWDRIDFVVAVKHNSLHSVRRFGCRFFLFIFVRFTNSNGKFFSKCTQCIDAATLTTTHRQNTKKYVFTQNVIWKCVCCHESRGNFNCHQQEHHVYWHIGPISITCKTARRQIRLWKLNAFGSGFYVRELPECWAFEIPYTRLSTDEQCNMCVHVLWYSSLHNLHPFGGFTPIAFATNIGF